VKPGPVWIGCGESKPPCPDRGSSPGPSSPYWFFLSFVLFKLPPLPQYIAENIRVLFWNINYDFLQISSCLLNKLPNEVNISQPVKKFISIGWNLLLISVFKGMSLVHILDKAFAVLTFMLYSWWAAVSTSNIHTHIKKFCSLRKFRIEIRRHFISLCLLNSPSS
jgi:hypothetical protein